MVEVVLSIIFGGGIIGLGLYILISWKLLKSDYSIIKAKLVNIIYRGIGYKYKRGCTIIEYTINNKEYRRTITVEKESPLYYRNYRERI